MSDNVAVMNGGVFVEGPQELYLRPRSAFTATFLGETNLIAGKVVGRAASDGLWQVETRTGLWSVQRTVDRQAKDSVWVACATRGRSSRPRPPRERLRRGRITTVVFAGIRSCIALP
jgi:ABC-type Fe3+/spermidine/putrescine transport system ATPase subunit